MGQVFRKLEKLLMRPHTALVIAVASCDRFANDGPAAGRESRGRRCFMAGDRWLATAGHMAVQCHWHHGWWRRWPAGLGHHCQEIKFYGGRCRVDGINCMA